MKKRSATSCCRHWQKGAKIKVWKAAEAVWRKALRLSIRAKGLQRIFTCRLQWNSLGHVQGGKSLDTSPEEELWRAVVPGLVLSSPDCTYCVLGIVWGTVLSKKDSHSAYWWLWYFIMMFKKKLSSDENAAREYLQLLTAQTWQRLSRCLCHKCLYKSVFPSGELFQCPDTCVVLSLCLFLQ